MESLNKKQWHVFWVTCATVAVALVIRVVPLLPLYMDADLRSRTQKVLQGVSAREGWMLSGVSMKHVSRDALQVQYRSYKRGKDTVECYDIDLQTGSLSPCNAS